MSMLKSFKEAVDRRNPRAGRALLESWSRNINAVRRSDPNFDDEKALKLAAVLENTKKAMRKAMNESTQVPDVGPFKFQVFDIITGLYPTMIADQLVSVQPMAAKMAQIFFLRYLYGNDRGIVHAGDDMLSPWTGAAPYNNYAGETISEEPVDDAVLSAGSGTVTLDCAPVRKGTLVITDGAITLKDNGNGKLLDASSAPVGDIDYQAGTVTMTASPGTMTDATASYFEDLEFARTNSGEINVKVEETILTARPHKLRSLFSFDAGYDVEMQYGIKLDEAMLQAATSEIRHERDGNVIQTLFQRAGSTSTWSKEIPVAISQKQHYETFVTELNNCAKRIYQETKRAMGNWVVVGLEGMIVLNTVGAPQFVGTSEVAPGGPYKAGVLNNTMNVYFDPFLPEDAYLVGYKGESFWDAGFVLGDYLPVFSSQLVMLDDFMARRGYCSMYGTKLVNNRMYVRGKILNTGSQYATGGVCTCTTP